MSTIILIILLLIVYILGFLIMQNDINYTLIMWFKRNLLNIISIFLIFTNIITLIFPPKMIFDWILYILIMLFSSGLTIIDIFYISEKNKTYLFDLQKNQIISKKVKEIFNFEITDIKFDTSQNVVKNQQASVQPYNNKKVIYIKTSKLILIPKKNFSADIDYFCHMINIYLDKYSINNIENFELSFYKNAELKKYNYQIVKSNRLKIYRLIEKIIKSKKTKIILASILGFFLFVLFVCMILEVFFNIPLLSWIIELLSYEL